MGRRNQHCVKYITINDMNGKIIQRYELDNSGRLIKKPASLDFTFPSQPPAQQQRNLKFQSTSMSIPMPQIQQTNQSVFVGEHDMFKEEKDIISKLPITPKMRQKPLSSLNSLFTIRYDGGVKMDNVILPPPVFFFN